MDALSLHHAIFTDEKDSDLPLRSATFLHPVPERDGSPTCQLFASAAYQDLIQRQPTHPDGPTSGWDLGLNLLGDPITVAECKSLEDHQIKMKLRRLHAINITFELLFGIWGTYTTVRYFLASADGLGDTERICALVLGIVSALAVALVSTAILIPLFPRTSRPHVWWYTRSLLRAGYLLLLFAGAVVNIVLVLIPQLLHVAQHHSPRGCPAAILRLVVMATLALSFIYTLRLYHRTRHPNFDGNSPKYSPYLPSDPEDISPVFRSSPLHLSKSTFRLVRSEDSSHTLNQSNTTLPKSNSISTLAPSTSCTGHSRSHSTPPPKDISLPRISSPTSRRTSTHVTNHGASSTPFGSETPSQTQHINAVTPPLSASHMLRRASRISITQLTSDTMLSDNFSHSERANGSILARDPSQIRSYKPGHRGTSAQPDTSVGPQSFSSTEGESSTEMGKDDDILAYSYGYGASEPTYPYLDTYNPQRPGTYAEAPSCEDEEERGFSQGYRRAIPGGPVLPEVSSEPRSSFSGEEEEESSGEEEEYVAMMGGFVRRMATIESLGSKEAASTLSTTGSVAPNSMRSKTPLSQFSSVRFAEHGSTDTSSLGMPLSTDGSLSTAYFSFSSGGTGMRVNERGELFWGPNASRSAAGSPHDRQYYTASGPGIDNETQ
ncbi:hypothetical protein JVT61DRAFT_4759 [Boletus reticuloceps]|uniref:Uncharacterized protein n=1 Tax=Boletus reticuloceps TaxID=495285 RepID=A0A8I2YLQ4_9AGAM|nr:hypothetical protein JVT61DRAFT_4759 [Boletus reticuloceps]